MGRGDVAGAYGAAPAARGNDAFDRDQDRPQDPSADRVGETGGARYWPQACPTTEMAPRLKALEGESHELRQASEILSKASAHFAQAEFGPRSKP